MIACSKLPKGHIYIRYISRTKSTSLLDADFLLGILYGIMLITVAARSKAENVFAHSKTGIVVSNPTQDMGVCVYSVCVALYR
jgi:hypothetical protein